MESRIERLCIERGLKMTGQRRVIARVLSEAEDHPDVEELYRRAAQLDSRISVATVYRTVRLLEEKGILERRDFGGGRARYEASEHGHHYHLIDIDTGRVVEFEDPALGQLMREIAGRLGFALMSHRMELFGRRSAGTEVASAAEASPVSVAQSLSPAQTSPLPQQTRTEALPEQAPTRGSARARPAASAGRAADTASGRAGRESGAGR